MQLELPAIEARRIMTGLPRLSIYGDDQRFLRSRRRIQASGGHPIRIVDLFSGGGGLSLAAELASAELSRKMEPVAAVELDTDAASVYSSNFPDAQIHTDIRELFTSFGSILTTNERKLRNAEIEVLLAGPPCQGHSDLNNYTRRNDERNSLYFVVARAAEVLRPQHVVIENVPGVRHDRRSVVSQTAEALQSLGYSVSGMLLDAFDYGVAQHRKRFFLIASQVSTKFIVDTLEQSKCENRDLRWAIGDLEGRSDRTTMLDSPGETRGDNLRRIDELFDRNLFDLPDEFRPVCHREKDHSYNSVYGRLRWDRPSQTITRGFHSVCMGRYIHPSERRSITAHEAARIQTIPDFFDFSKARTKSSLAKIIANVVPPKLGAVVINSLLQAENYIANG